MASKGDTVENPVTGERTTYLETSEETDGEYANVELYRILRSYPRAQHLGAKNVRAKVGI